MTEPCVHVYTFVHRWCKRWTRHPLTFLRWTLFHPKPKKDGRSTTQRTRSTKTTTTMHAAWCFLRRWCTHLIFKLQIVSSSATLFTFEYGVGVWAVLDIHQLFCWGRYIHVMKYLFFARYVGMKGPKASKMCFLWLTTCMYHWTSDGKPDLDSKMGPRCLRIAFQSARLNSLTWFSFWNIRLGWTLSLR